MENQIIHGDCFEVLASLPDKSIDAIITDPPYGIGIAEWDSVVDIPLFTAHAKRVSREFYSFFGQMPTVVNWINAANDSGMKYREHISWVKRNVGISRRLSRCHESIFIYGDSTDFYETKGRFEDVKTPGILFDVSTIEGFQRAYSEAQALLKGNSLSPVKTSCINRQPEFSRYDNTDRRSRAYEFANFTNVWSFLPPTYSTERIGSGIYHHPCEKPLEVMKRLVEMLTPEGGTVLDPFAGSGTTAIACLETGRNYICVEQSEEYIQTIHKRVGDWHSEHGYRHTLEERVAWLETQVQAQGSKIKKLEGDRQLSLWDVMG
jgi:site-specific DNA-methyltransferase (adenine-specific)